MRSERGQASVEWIGILLLVALALAALSRFAEHADGRSLGATLAHSITAPPGQVAEMGSAERNVPLPPGNRAITAPPLVPHPEAIRTHPSVRRSGGLRLPAGDRLELTRIRRGVGVAWRRAWFACLAYERVRYGFLHPESRFPGHTMEPSEVLRIANDCISPVDLVRDWSLLRGR